jgi:hypothetical protein
LALVSTLPVKQKPLWEKSLPPNPKHRYRDFSQGKR